MIWNYSGFKYEGIGIDISGLGYLSYVWIQFNWYRLKETLAMESLFKESGYAS